ncbi:MAG TPA: nucleotidyltransferase family protein, partial [Longimicrobium sp.]|nr:nucleotidyltransferase family protein [Longimicrobium sp.]
MTPPDALVTARAALSLRPWALGVLAAGGPGEGDGAAGAPPPDAPDEAWTVFLRVERCALPLRARVLARGTELPPAAAAALARRAEVELRRALSARAQLVTLSRILSPRGASALVLKGGVTVLGADPLDVLDVDVLVRPDQAREVAAALEQVGGHRPHGADAAPGTPGTFHLSGRAAPDAIQVEVHYALPYAGEVDPWAGAVPAGLPGILRLAPAAHLWHVLVHGVVHHPERRSTLREMLLLAAAVAACGADDLAGVEARAAAHPDAPLLLHALQAARALSLGRPADPFRAAAALAYLVGAGAIPRAYRGRFGIDLVRTACALVAGEGAY